MFRIAGACTIQNSIDVLPALCGHYLRLGFDRLMFIDDRSTDGTFEFLEALSRRDRRVVVEQGVMDPSAQGALMTQTCNRLIAEGYDLIVPFDSDEWWNLKVKQIARLCAEHPEALVRGRFCQFVQARSVGRSGPLDLLKAVYRAPELRKAADVSVDLHGTYLCFSKDKIAFRSAGPVLVGSGQHQVFTKTKLRLVADEVEVFHLIVRSAEQIDVRSQRAWNYYWKDGRTPKGRRLIWAANSANRHGCLDTPFGEMLLIPDRRLRIATAKAMAWFGLRHPLLFARAWDISGRSPRTRRWSGARVNGRRGPPALQPARLAAGLAIALVGGLLLTLNVAPNTTVDEILAVPLTGLGLAISIAAVSTTLQGAGRAALDEPESAA